MSNLFAKVEQEAFRAGITPRTKQSRAWFRSKLASMGRVNRNQLMRDEQVKLVNKSQPMIGSMNMFFYDPKHKDTLPYYDRFPLSVIIGPAPGGFKGLNLHYLPPTLRAKMLDGLMDITNNKKFDDSTRFAVSYKLLDGVSKLKYFRPCLKHYLFSQVRSKLARVSAPEWEIATFLPTADFQGNKTKIYADSRRMI